MARLHRRHLVTVEHARVSNQLFRSLTSLLQFAFYYCNNYYFNHNNRTPDVDEREVPATFSLKTLRETIATIPSGEVDLIVTNFPHNPTGFLPTVIELGGLVEIARSLDCFLFNDEM